MKRIGIIAKKSHPHTEEILGRLLPQLSEYNMAVVVEEHLRHWAGAAESSDRETIAENIDALIVLGGDGTLLSAARIPGIEKVIILPVNLGGLGFLTEVRIEEINTAIERIVSGRYEIDRRMMLDIRVKKTVESGMRHFRVLNDVVVNKGALARMINLETYVNDEYLNTFKADGLIIATPTGSTGYSLSAGGPIIYPSLTVISITPICPHTLSNRPVILTDTSVIDVTLTSYNEDVFITMDGQVGLQMEQYDSLRVEKAPACLSIIKTPFRSYFSVLKEKLKWGER